MGSITPLSGTPFHADFNELLFVLTALTLTGISVIAIVAVLIFDDPLILGVFHL
jgi:hypothetical protein